VLPSAMAAKSNAFQIPPLIAIMLLAAELAMVLGGASTARPNMYGSFVLYRPSVFLVGGMGSASSDSWAYGKFA
jgi:hypothetical protein